MVRSTVINAPADKVYALVADPRGWTQWSAWNKRDPAMQITYSGPPSGAMSFTAAEPGRRVAFDLHFPDFGTTSKGELRFVPQAGSAQVTWTMNGDMGSNPLFHWMALMADSMVGKDFEAGLAGLRKAAEKP